MVLPELLTEQVSKVLRASLSVHIYAGRYGRIREKFLHRLRKWNVLATLLNCVQFLQSVLDNSQEKAHIPYGMRVRTAVETQLNFYAMTFLVEELEG